MKATGRYSICQQAKWMWRASLGMRLQAILNAVCGVLAVATDFLSIYFTKQIVDIATGGTGNSLTTGGSGNSFTTAAVWLVLIMAMRIVLSISMRWIKAMLGVKAQNRLQSRIFERMLLCRWQGRERHHSGDILNRLERDVRDVVGVITETMPQTIAVAVRLIGAFAFMAMMNWRLAVTVVLILPIFLSLSRLYVGRMREYTRKVRQSDSAIQSLLQESVQHRLVIKTLQAAHTALSWLHEAQAILHGQIRRRTLFATMSGLTVNLGFSTAYLVTFIWAAHSLQQGAITYGMMLAFVQLVGQIQQPFREMTRFVPILVQALTAGERMMELESLEYETDSTPTETKLPKPSTPLPHQASNLTPHTSHPITLHPSAPIGFRLTNVSYHYPDGQREVLDNVSIHFAPGKITALVGETGIGKTTIIRLLLGLFPPTSGTVEMYGEGWSHTCSAYTRQHITYVPQGNTLLSGTVRRNLLLASPDATDEEMLSALRTACADFITDSQEGLDTLCGEMGAGMSEGQAQRICIARSLLRHTDVLLMDEATSALDEATELRLLNNLRSLAAGRTIIFITHRPAVLQYCDEVVGL